MITNSGTIIRTPVKDIPIYSRGASGVIVMRLTEGQSIVNFTKVASAEEEAAALDTADKLAQAEDVRSGDEEPTEKIITQLPTEEE